jgi:hypothetical protein
MNILLRNFNSLTNFEDKLEVLKQILYEFLNGISVETCYFNTVGGNLYIKIGNKYIGHILIKEQLNQIGFITNNETQVGELQKFFDTKFYQLSDLESLDKVGDFIFQVIKTEILSTNLEVSHEVRDYYQNGYLPISRF